MSKPVMRIIEPQRKRNLSSLVRLMKVVRVWCILKPALRALPSINRGPQTFRGCREQRDETERLGTWDRSAAEIASETEI